MLNTIKNLFSRGNPSSISRNRATPSPNTATTQLEIRGAQHEALSAAPLRSFQPFLITPKEANSLEGTNIQVSAGGDRAPRLNPEQLSEDESGVASSDESDEKSSASLSANPQKGVDVVSQSSLSLNVNFIGDASDEGSEKEVSPLNSPRNKAVIPSLIATSQPTRVVRMFSQKEVDDERKSHGTAVPKLLQLCLRSVDVEVKAKAALVAKSLLANEVPFEKESMNAEEVMAFLEKRINKENLKPLAPTIFQYVKEMVDLTLGVQRYLMQAREWHLNGMEIIYGEIFSVENELTPSQRIALFKILFSSHEFSVYPHAPRQIHFNCINDQAQGNYHSSTEYVLNAFYSSRDFEEALADDVVVELYGKLNDPAFGERVNSVKGTPLFDQISKFKRDINESYEAIQEDLNS